MSRSWQTLRAVSKSFSVSEIEREVRRSLLSLSHTHIHTHTYIHRHTETYTYTHRHTQTYTHTQDWEALS